MIEVVGSGFALAPTSTGPMRILLPLAAHRALYDALTKLAIALHEQAGTTSSRQQVALSGSEYRAVVDGPNWKELGRKLANPKR